MSSSSNVSFTMPTYNYVNRTPGINEQELVNVADYLSTTFNISRKEFKIENGTLSYFDPAAYGAIPMNTVPAKDIPSIYKTGEETQTVFDALMINKLREIKCMPSERAIEYCNEIIKRLNLENSSMKMTLKTNNTKFQLVFAKGIEGTPIEYGTFDIDTKVVGRFTLNGIPVEGSGAKFVVNFNERQPTNVHIYMSKFTIGPLINIQTPENSISNHYVSNVKNARINARLVYHAPDFLLSNGQSGLVPATSLLPAYIAGGEFINNKGQISNLLEKYIPAVNDYSHISSVSITTTAVLNKDNTYTINVVGTIVAESELLSITVSSGNNTESIPWIYDTNSNWVPGTNNNGLSVAKQSDGLYNFRFTYICSSSNFKNESNVSLNSLIIASGVNGNSVSKSDNISLVFTQQRTAGTTDFGIEHSISDGLGAELVRRYRDKMLEYASKSYQWASSTTYENDWKVQANYDLYVGNTDEAFYCGHGSPNGFSFENNVSDTWLNYDDIPAGLWGQKDLDWVVLTSCQCLRETNSSGTQWYTRWGAVFGGLHLICGFHTNANDVSTFGRKFAMYQGARDGKPATPIRSAWCKANDEDQPADNVVTIMGVCGGSPNSQTINYGGQVIQNYNDYYHGKGTGSGPDIPRNSITCFWRVTSTS